MSDDLNHLSYLDKLQEDSFDCYSLQSNSFIMKFLKEFNEECLNDLKSISSLSKSSNDLYTVIVNKTSQDCVDPNQIDDDQYFHVLFHKNLPSAAWRMSEAVTSAKNSFADDLKETRGKYSIHQSGFAMPNKIFCTKCEQEVFTQVFSQSVKPDFWASVEGFFSSTFKCCEKISKEKQELIHTCRQCHRVLARISSE